MAEVRTALDTRTNGSLCPLRPVSTCKTVNEILTPAVILGALLGIVALVVPDVLTRVAVSLSAGASSSRASCCCSCRPTSYPM